MIWEVMIIKYFDLIFLLVFYNIIPMWTELNIHIAVKIAGTIILSMLFIIDLIRSEPTPVKGFVKGFRLRSLRRGTSLIWISAASLIPETAIIVMDGHRRKADQDRGLRFPAYFLVGTCNKPRADMAILQKGEARVYF